MSWLPLIPLTVLLGAVFNGWLALRDAHEEKASEELPTWVGCFAPIIAFVLSLSAFSALRMPGAVPLQVRLYEWFTSGNLSVDIALRVDELSAVMLLVITGVGSLIHIYSMGYMHRDPGYARFYAYLNLFMFFMIVLVMADSLVLLFLGWEGVGLTSYLLIGFWWKDAYKADCGKKAFIVNRIGDLGFLLGLAALFSLFGTLSVHGVGESSVGLVTKVKMLVGRNPDAIVASGVFEGWTYSKAITVACILLFLGACGKSAQIPLFVWLPDAMAGPTPVSALIHAATMVTAGVYMIARMGFLYALSPTAMAVVACTGALTAIVAASIGLVQNDIKKILAYSTISQLGFMFIAVGVGAYGAGVFHLFTHAFFKACLFLGAGSVIHAMHEEQDIRKMGGLRELVPHTYWTFVIASLAIAGVFPFAGFFSKDEVLLMAFTSTPLGGLGTFLWAVGFAAAGMTAFYMFRLVFVAFHGECRADKHVQHRIHESPFSMVSVLWMLAIGSALVGFLGFPHWNPFGKFLDQLFEADRVVAHHAHHPSAGLELALAGASLVWALCWILVAKRFYLDEPGRTKGMAERYSNAYRLISEKYFVDEIYEGAVVEPIWAASSGFLHRIVDVRVIDGLVNAFGILARILGEVIRIVQTGVVRTYIIFLLAGAVLILWSIVL